MHRRPSISLQCVGDHMVFYGEKSFRRSSIEGGYVKVFFVDRRPMLRTFRLNNFLKVFCRSLSGGLLWIVTFQEVYFG